MQYFKNNKKKYDECAICRKKNLLTFEHIPPNKAFNNRRARVISGDEIIRLIGEEDRKPWDYTGLKYTQNQKGMGLYSLCSNCNNVTGSYYGGEYNKVATAFHQALQVNDLNPNDFFECYMEKISPLKFAKQVLSMFCSTFDTFTLNNPEVKDLLLDREKKGIDITKIKLYMFLIKDYRISWTGINALGNLSGFTRVVAEVDAYPFGFVLELDPKEKPIKDILDITYFLTDYDIKDTPKVSLSIPLKERNIIFPIDFRSKDEIEQCKKENQEKMKQMQEKSTSN